MWFPHKDDKKRYIRCPLPLPVPNQSKLISVYFVGLYQNSGRSGSRMFLFVKISQGKNCDTLTLEALFSNSHKHETAEQQLNWGIFSL